MSKVRIYLSRRNLVTLLNKLDRPESKKSIVKYDTLHPTFPCSHQALIVAVEDDDYYTDRVPGSMHPSDYPGPNK